MDTHPTFARAALGGLAGSRGATSGLPTDQALSIAVEVGAPQLKPRVRASSVRCGVSERRR